MKSEKIRFEFVRTSCLTRYPCHICGGRTEKGSILSEVTDGPYKGLRICEFCLEAGEEKIHERLEAHINQLEDQAAELKSLAGRLEIPTYEAFRAAVEKENREYMEAREKEFGPYIEPEVTDGADLPF